MSNGVQSGSFMRSGLPRRSGLAGRTSPRRPTSAGPVNHPGHAHMSVMSTLAGVSFS